MNIVSPFYLYKNDKLEFLKKVCAICLSTLYYPEIGDKMTKCCRLNCFHSFHQECLDQLFLQNHKNCPECREPVKTVTNVSQSLELTIRNDAFEHNNIDEELRKQFTMSGVKIDDYPYHKVVFERWGNEVLGNEVLGNDVLGNEVLGNEVLGNEVLE